MQKNHSLQHKLILPLVAGLCSLMMHGVMVWVMWPEARESKESPIRLVHAYSLASTRPKIPPLEYPKEHAKGVGRFSRGAKEEKDPSPAQETASEAPTSNFDPSPAQSFSPLADDQLSHRAIPLSANKHKPLYPPKAIALGVEGSVIVSIEVTKEGKVHRAHIKQGVGYGLDESALAAVQRFEFEPARDLAGHATDSTLEHEFRFQLE
jgi:TonB family protein